MKVRNDALTLPAWQLLAPQVVPRLAGLIVERGSLVVPYAADRQQRPQGGGLLGAREQRVGGERRTQMKRRRHPRRPERPRTALAIADRDVERRLQGRLIERAQQLEERDVRGAATQIDMLAVVDLDPGLVVGEAERLATQERASLDERHLGAQKRRFAGGGDAGQPTAADHDVAGSHLTVKVSNVFWLINASLRGVDNEMRSVKTS